MVGENPMWVAKQMGHTDWSLTAKRYGRWITSDMLDGGAKAVEAWSQLGHISVISYLGQSGEGGIRTPGTAFDRTTV